MSYSYSFSSLNLKLSNDKNNQRKYMPGQTMPEGNCFIQRASKIVKRDNNVLHAPGECSL